MKHFCSFSEAIREGAKLRPQNFGAGMNLAKTKTCAYVAGIEAITGDLVTSFDPLAAFPYLGQVKACCPVMPCAFGDPMSLNGVIFHLNDVHRWTREAIADWLEAEEENIGYVTLIESESSSESLQRAGAYVCDVNG